MSVHLTSATEDEMRALQHAFHKTMEGVDTPGWRHGTAIAVRGEGPVAYSAETPLIPRPHVQDMLVNLSSALEIAWRESRHHPTPEERGEEPIPPDGLEQIAHEVTVTARTVLGVGDTLSMSGEDPVEERVFDVLHRYLGGGG